MSFCFAFGCHSDDEITLLGKGRADSCFVVVFNFIVLLSLGVMSDSIIYS